MKVDTSALKLVEPMKRRSITRKLTHEARAERTLPMFGAAS